jgi:hypothetical protein
MTEAELEIAQEKVEMLIQQRIEHILEIWLIQGGIIFAFIGVMFVIFGFRRTALTFFALYALTVLTLPSAFNMLLGGLMLVAMIVNYFLKRGQPHLPPDAAV